MSEATRYELAARYFRSSIQFTLSPPTILDSYSRDEIPLHPLPSRFLQNFHYKDTAVYNLAVRADIEDVFDEIWKTWYPRRNMDMDKNTNAFFCRALKPRGPEVRKATGLKDVIGLHEELVKQADADVEDRKGKKDEDEQETSGKKPKKPLDGGLEDSFKKIFVVLDKEEWEEDGVLLVCREESVKDFGLGEYVAEGESEAEEGKGKAVGGGWVTFRKKVEDAVKTVISDPERKKAEAPTLEAYREKKFQI
ncbi:hypothetical protein FQN54_009466 [Arachnomyces sp. PD_36]|nr:hypothetical protein FQN54_009466 [Arachnomyces sp. PD_36]